MQASLIKQSETHFRICAKCVSVCVWKKENMICSAQKPNKSNVLLLLFFTGIFLELCTQKDFVIMLCVF